MLRRLYSGEWFPLQRETNYEEKAHKKSKNFMSMDIVTNSKAVKLE